MKQLPNALTLLRFMLIPILAWLIIVQDYKNALYLAVIAGLTDAADGFLAKRYNWVSQFGGIADPLADKLLMITAFACLATAGLLPWWLFILTSARDLIIVIGAITYHYLIDKVTGSPNWASKANTAMQISLVAIVLLHASGYQAIPQLRTLLISLVSLLSIVSMLQYLVVWSNKARGLNNQENNL